MTSKAQRAAEQLDATLYEIMRLVRPLHRQLAAAVDARLPAGVTAGTRGVLERLSEGGPQTVPQVARALMVGRQFIQKVANAALARGLVRLVPNPAHRRSGLLELTKRGRALFGAIRRGEQKVVRLAAAGVSRRDVHACRRVLAHMTSELARRRR